MNYFTASENGTVRFDSIEVELWRWYRTTGASKITKHIINDGLGEV